MLGGVHWHAAPTCLFHCLSATPQLCLPPSWLSSSTCSCGCKFLGAQPSALHTDRGTACAVDA